MPELTPYEHRGTCNAGLSHIGARDVVYRPAGLAYWTLNLSVSGIGYFREIDHIVTPGDCVLIPPHHHHEYGTLSTQADHWDHYWATFPAHPLITDLLNWTQHKGAHAVLTLAAGPIREYCIAAFATLVDRADEAWPMRDELCMSQLRVVLSWMNPTDAAAPSSRPIQRALDEIHAAPERDWSVDELAQRVGWSNSRLSHVFTQEVGVSPRRYIERCRMHLAQGLLQSSESSIAAIAQRVGYEDPNYFCRRFRMYANNSPTKYRQGMINRLGT